MIYVLVLWMYVYEHNGAGFTVSRAAQTSQAVALMNQEFNSREACNSALRTVHSLNGDIGGTCVPKGDVK